MKTTLLLLTLACASAVMPLRAVDGLLTADAYVNSALPANNFGATPTMLVAGTASSYILFDLSPLPAGTTTADISKANLILYADRVAASGLLNLSTVASTWSELSLTFSSVPALMPSGATPAAIAQTGQYVVFDVTTEVRNWINSPALNFGLRLSADPSTPNMSVQFDTKENSATSHPARLEIVLVNAGPPGLQGPQGPQGPNGLQGPIGPPGRSGIALMDQKFGNQVDLARSAAGGAPCTIGQIVLSAAAVTTGIPAQGQILPINQNAILFSLLGNMYLGYQSDIVFALPDLRRVTPNLLTSTVCTNGNYPQ